MVSMEETSAGHSAENLNYIVSSISSLTGSSKVSVGRWVVNMGSRVADGEMIVKIVSTDEVECPVVIVIKTIEEVPLLIVSADLEDLIVRILPMDHSMDLRTEVVVKSSADVDRNGAVAASFRISRLPVIFLFSISQ